MTRFRPAFVLLLSGTLASAALAQPAPLPPPMPPSPPPVDAAPLPPPVASDPDLEPQVTVEEVRIGGVLKFVRVTPVTGRPYYLVPNGTGTAFIRRDSLDTGLSVPLWVLFSW
jgi:hypothetical protein